MTFNNKGTPHRHAYKQQGYNKSVNHSRYTLLRIILFLQSFQDQITS